MLYDTIIYRYSYENGFIPVQLRSFKRELFLVSIVWPDKIVVRESLLHFYNLP